MYRWLASSKITLHPLSLIANLSLIGMSWHMLSLVGHHLRLPGFTRAFNGYLSGIGARVSQNEMDRCHRRLSRILEASAYFCKVQNGDST